METANQKDVSKCSHRCSKFRRPIGTIVEIFLPIFAVVFIIILRRYLNFKDERRCFTTFEPDPLNIPQTPTFLYSDHGSIAIHDVYYTPRTKDTSAIMSIVAKEVGLPYSVGFRITSFDTEEEVLENLALIDRNKTLYNACLYGGAGIIFNELYGNELRYTIRLPHEVGRANSWKTIQTSPNFELPGPRRSNLYLFEGFVQLQKLVGDAITEWYADRLGIPYQYVNVSVRQLPYPEYTINEFLSSVNIILPLFFVLAFLYTSGSIVKELVLEKETRIRESMLMMGLKQWVLWATWFTKQLLFLTPTIFVITFLAKFLLFKQSDWVLLFIFFMLYLVSLISYSFMISVWFSSARVGLIVGFIAWFANFFPFLFLFMRYRSISFFFIAISCLLSNTALGFGVEIIARLEQRTVGLLWSNVGNPITLDDSFNMAWVLGMLVIDSVLYMTIAWYVNEVKPGEYGIPKPFYFPILPSYWCNTKRIFVKSHNLEPSLSADKYDPAAHEKLQGNLQVGISIRNLTKIYSRLFFGSKGARKKAVDNLNLEIYQGQITALLGHNGAGKTTTMSILTGLFTPTGGTAIINGNNILTDMDLIRDSLGICPQHNILFGRLTVREHLTFFIRLKGIFNHKVIKDEVDRMLEDLYLCDKGNIQASCLSGGMKRKLSVGIALIGGSRVVILDEPTAGMDPYARRATWDLLAKYKHNRCILMSTHLMDEADLLGDRIAIMAEGKLRCSGSSLFLKSRYGVGYHMTLVKKSPKCLSLEVENVVKSYVPSAEIVTDVGMELSFILPSSEAYKFPDLFDKLEAMKEVLNISSYGISITTMEEVFIKVGEGTDDSLRSASKMQPEIPKKKSKKFIKIKSKHHLSLLHSEKGLKQDHSIRTAGSIQISLTDESRVAVNKINSRTESKIKDSHLLVAGSGKREQKLSGEMERQPHVLLLEKSGTLSVSSAPSGEVNLSPLHLSSSNPEMKEPPVQLTKNESFKIAGEDFASEAQKMMPPKHLTAGFSRPDCTPSTSKKIELSQGNTSDVHKSSLTINNIKRKISLPPLRTKIPIDVSPETPVPTSDVAGDVNSMRKKNLVPLPPINSASLKHSIIEKQSVPSSRFGEQKRQSLSTVKSSETGGSTSGQSEPSHVGSRDWLKLNYQYEPNKGIVLWLQQFRAMFIKRIYYSIRFYPALITQLLFPVVFAAIGLAVILSNPKNDDPPRALYINTNGLDSRNTTVFYAELDGKTMNFSDFTAEDLSVTDYIDITAGINEIRASVSDLQDIDECCNYQYQILDKFCASRNSHELQHCKENNTSFGYGRCIHCLTCCDSVNKIDSCTFPTSVYVSPPTNASGCPSPPSLSLHSSTHGPLDTTSTFIAEYLLRKASKEGAVSFYRSYQAGFTVAAQDPIISSCGCPRADGISLKGCLVFQRLGITPCHGSPGICPRFHYVSPFQCPMKQINETLCRRKPKCYSVEPYSSDFLQSIACSADGNRLCGLKDPQLLKYSYPPPFTDKRSLARVYPEVLSTPAVTVWYNNGPFHMIAAAFNAYQSLRLKQITKIKELSLVVVNHPLPRNPKAVAQDATEDFTGFGLAILVVCGYSFFLGNFIIFLVKEKESKAKHLQFVSGVSVTSYWLSAIAWDLVNAFLPIFFTLVVFRGFPLSAFHGSSLTAIMLVLVLTCWASIPCTYILSFFFKSALAAFSVVIILFFFVTVLLLTAIFLVQLYGKENKEQIVEILHHLFLVSPTYGLASLLSDIYINYQIMLFCPKHPLVCDFLNLTYVDTHLIFKRPGVGIICVFLSIQGFVFLIITLLLEWKCFIPHLKRYFKAYKTITGAQCTKEEGEDEDVHAEKMRVLTDDISNDIVVIKNLVKIYRRYLVGCSLRPPKTAVAGITLGIPCGECFGLLGVNGAGKTTTFSILTGDINMTSGTAIIGGKDIRTSLKSVRQGLGYCPQFDALIERMTSREQLWMYARLRGVPEKQINEVVDSEIRRLDLFKYADSRCGTYSGGIKRKLSTAIAIVGNPPLILLDEPTTGMDPNTRRYLWDVLTKLVKDGRSIILTSHSMEECEALCTRLAIMVNGQFKCLGSIQHLKNKFGKGITLQAKVRHQPTECSTLHDQSESSRRSRTRGIFSSLHGATSSQIKSRLFSWHDQKAKSDNKISGTGLDSNSKKISGNVSEVTNQGITASFHSFVNDNFSGAVLLEEHAGAITYWLPSEGVSWSFVFRLLEINKEELGIIDYSVSQTTLEQVFINFAKEQEEQLDNQ